MTKRENNIISPEKTAAMRSAVADVRAYTDAARADGSRPLAHIMTFGCQQNEADSERLAGLARAMGYELSPTPERCSLVLVNTCAVREHAEKRALSVIGQLKHQKAKFPEMIIGVGGCMASQPHRAETLKRSYPYVDFSFCTTELWRVPELISARLAGGGRVFSVSADALETTDFSEDIPVARSSRTHAWVSVMYGCNNFCSYCIVPYVRGRERSRTPEDVESEVRGLVADGCRDITLLGQNVNSYGHDLASGVTFADLITRLSAIDGDFRLRFMTSHPKDATSDLIEAMAKSRVAAHHFHLPLQSGSDRVLERMNRRYDSSRYLDIVRELRAAMPDITITSDIIVGFPGETEEDFEATLDVIRRARFDMIYSFIFSPRRGTPAFDMDDQIPDEVKSARFARLIETQNAVSLERNRAAVGAVMRVLVDDEFDDPDSPTGRTEGGKLVHISGNVKKGEFCTVIIDDADTFSLRGKAID